jgi:hypothetical protein
MEFYHFYNHFAEVNDIFWIYNCASNVGRHKVKEVKSSTVFTCHCPREGAFICNDLNYVLDKWEAAAVFAHGTVTASPPGWRKIEVGKYLTLQQVFQAATYAVMLGGAVLMQKASLKAHIAEFGGGEIAKVSFSAHDYTLVSISDVEIAQVVASDATILEVGEASINSLNVSIDSQTFRDMSSELHSLSGNLTEVVASSGSQNSTFINSVLVAPEVEGEIIASINNTFSESAFQHKILDFDMAASVSDVAESVSTSICKPAQVNEGVKLLKKYKMVMVNEAKMPAALEQDMIATINNYKMTGSINKMIVRQIMKGVETKIGRKETLKLYLESFKTTLKPVRGHNYIEQNPDAVKKAFGGNNPEMAMAQFADTHDDLSFYKKLCDLDAVNEVALTAVDDNYTAITETKKEFCQQTSLNVKATKICEIQRLNADQTLDNLKLHFKSVTTPWVGHSCIQFTSDSSITLLPNVQYVVSVDNNSYLVNGVFEGVLWAYCDRTHIKDAEALAKESKYIKLTAQKRRSYTTDIHVGATVSSESPTKVTIHKDLKGVVELCPEIWTSYISEKRVYKKEEYTLTGAILEFKSSVPWGIKSPIFISPFRFNGIEGVLMNSHSTAGNCIVRLPSISTVLPYNYYQVNVYDKEYKLLESKLQSFKNLVGVVKAADYLDIRNPDVLQTLSSVSSEAAYKKTISFFSTYDYEPVRIKSIVFNRPWSITTDFYYMTISLESAHKIDWQKWAKRNGGREEASFSMSIVGEHAQKHLRASHRSNLRISSIKDSTTIIFTVPDYGNEDDIHPDVFIKGSYLGLPLDENMSLLQIQKRAHDLAMAPNLS